MEWGIENQVAVVTTGGDALGARLIDRLVREGNRLAILETSGLGERQLGEEIGGIGNISFLKKVDLRSKDEVAQCFEEIHGHYGRVDMLIHAAEMLPPVSHFSEVLIPKWKETLDFNLRGTLLVCQEAVKLMRSQNYGRIVHVTSALSQDLPPGYGAYAISKLGVNALTELLAKEEARFNIRVNAVALGPVSGISGALYGQEDSEGHKEMLSQKPMNNQESLDDIIETILFLVSDESDYITGQVINVSGLPSPSGRHLWKEVSK
jgi:NAD(P)-dependent dehydrogenase (short-subunit alcohol dehydrogenase family)